MFADKLCSLSDEDLVSKYFVTHSQRIFREIYRRYRDPLFRYCAQMAPQKCEPLMENFWRTFMHTPPRLSDRRLKNWLFIHINRLLQNADALPETAIAESESLRSALDNSDILRAIQQLPLRERNIFLLFTECGLSLATIADIEKLPLSLCRNFLQQSRQAVTLAIHGSMRKPWKSAATLAKEAAAVAEAQQEAAQQGIGSPANPRKPATGFPWKKTPDIAAASAAHADRSVEVV